MSFNNREVAHRWAHRDGSRGSGSHLSYDGPILKSYATAIAELIDLPDGGRGVVRNCTSYSSSTARHQSYARSAASHIPFVMVWDVPRGQSCVVLPKAGVKRWAREQLLMSLRKAAEEHAKAARCRKDSRRNMHLVDANELVENAQTLAAWFKVRMPEVDLSKLAEAAGKARAAEAKRQRAEQKKLELEKAKDIRDWQNGETNTLSGKLAKVYLRRVEGGPGGRGGVETSKGAIIPWDDALKLFRFAQAKRAKGWRRNGETFAIGPYQLDSVNKDGIVAGCHRISFDEIERLAKKEGVK
jgi:hypothetical protein